MSIFLRTARLELWQFTEEDGGSLFALDADPEVTRFTGPGSLRSPEAARAHIRDVLLPQYAVAGGLGCFAARELSGAFIGWFHLRPALGYRFAALAGYREGDLDLGYRLRREFWGKGYATEGASALVREAFVGRGARRVVATALVANFASTRVLEKTGLRRGTAFALPGFESPAVVYARTSQE